MNISEVRIKEVQGTNGLVGYATVIVDDWLRLNNISIFRRYDQPDKYRLVFPEKNLKFKTVSFFRPLTSDAYYALEKIVSEEVNKIIQNKSYEQDIDSRHHFGASSDRRVDQFLL